jgi:hypothetical protein
VATLSVSEATVTVTGCADWKLAYLVPQIIQAGDKFTTPCSNNNHTVKVDHSYDILYSMVSKVKNFESTPICLNVSSLNMHTSSNVQKLKDKIDLLLDMEKSTKTFKDIKKWIIIVVHTILYLGQTLNDTSLIKHLQDEANFTQVIDNWLNPVKDIFRTFKMACNKEALHLGQEFPIKPYDLTGDFSWPPATCIDPVALKKAAHAALDLIHDKLSSLFNEEADKQHLYQKTFSIATILQINSMGYYLSMVGVDGVVIMNATTASQQ